MDSKWTLWTTLACTLALGAAAEAGGIDPGRVHVPAAPGLPKDNALVLAGPGVRTAIIIGDVQPPYRFP